MSRSKPQLLTAETQARLAESTERAREALLFGNVREALGLHPEALAAILGTHLRTIFRWERAERAIPPYLWLTLALMLIRKRQLARALGLPLPSAARNWLSATSGRATRSPCR
jgi:DNA-binding transcriptional regulator YiaG